MKTERVILTVKEDPEFGGMGLEIEGVQCENFNPAQDGLVIAHDLLEHQNGAGAIGTIDDELEALGGIWFVRGQFNDLRRGSRIGGAYTVHENISADITRMFRDFFYGAEVDTHNVPDSEPCEADDDFRLILRHVANDYKDELDEAEQEEAEQRFSEYERVCLPRMRIGYAKAAERFPNAGAANDLFWAIVDACDLFCKGAEYEGAEYVLEYGFRDDGAPFARCEERYEDDDEEDDEEDEE